MGLAAALAEECRGEHVVRARADEGPGTAPYFTVPGDAVTRAAW